MSDFFRNLVSEGLILDWANILDWIFDDKRFSQERGWNGGYVGCFTRKVKKLPGIEKGYEPVNSSYVFSKSQTIGNRKKIKIVMNPEGESEGRGIVRHIRNGIAHGNTAYKKVESGDGKKLFIQIKDYKQDGKTQTADMFFPINYIVEIHKIYAEVEKSINNCKPKGRKTGRYGKEKKK